MADITAFAVSDSRVPSNTSTPQWFDVDITGTATIADSGESILAFNLPAGFVFDVRSFGHDSTLGASCTAQLRIGTTAITAATTAGGASSVTGNGADVDVSASAQEVNILIGGADVASAANFHVRGFIMQPHQITVP